MVRAVPPKAASMLADSVDEYGVHVPVLRCEREKYCCESACEVTGIKGNKKTAHLEGAPDWPDVLVDDGVGGLRGSGCGCG